MIESRILRYLGYPSGAEIDAETSAVLQKAESEVLEAADFRYLYAEFHELFPFLQKKAYADYLAGAERYLLCATTLGVEIDRRLKRWQLTDMHYATIFDATASAYLEQRADEFERTLPYPALGFRFCPGYAGSPLEDNRHIVSALHAERIGISFLDSSLMLPLKSMVGIVRIGERKTEKNCTNCAATANCPYRLKGQRCY